jgi:FMN phosphatase YigB (HAD superfamily)
MHLKESVEELKELLWESAKFHPATAEVARELKEKGVVIAIVSNHATEVKILLHRLKKLTEQSSVVQPRSC